MNIRQKIKTNIPLAPYTTFHIGGPADYFCKAESIDEIIACIEFAREKNMQFFVLGTGANILVGDKGFRGLVIKNESKRYSLTEENQQNDRYLVAESGITIAELISMTTEKSLSGLEHFAGIPSSLGGALWQNLHFLSPDRSKTIFIGEIVEGAEILTVSNEKKEVIKDYFRFGYDYSILHDTHDVVLRATLRLEYKQKQEIEKTIANNLFWRREKHPKDAEKRSAGSIFKKIEGYGAGRLIDKAGLKGKRIGNAEISTRHANFIMNTGNATATDVRKLIALVQEEVKRTQGLELQPEISFIGEF